jgi:hypothetical protein
MKKAGHLLAASLLLALAPWLGGCNDTAGGLTASTADGPRTPRFAARPGVRPSSVTVAFKSLDGAPPEVEARFVTAMSAALASRDIATAESSVADFIILGHLSAYPAENGTRVAWVWDVFDRNRNRRQRMDDGMTVRAAGGNPWTAVDERVLASVAGVTAEDLAGFLSNSPEAIAASSAGAPAVAAAPAPATGKPANALSFAADER